MQKHFSLFLNIFLFIVFLFLSLTACEFAARTLRLSKTYNSYPDFKSGTVNQVYSVKKNLYDWRDREFSKNKKINTFRIACIGDSVTEGYRVKLQNTFSKILEDSFQKMNYKVEVMNLGKCGNATPENLSTVMTVVEFNADLIIYQFGMNDVKGFEHRESVAQKEGAPSGITAGNAKQFNFKNILRKSVLYLALAERYNYLKLKTGCKTWVFDEWNIKDSMWEKEFSKFNKTFTEVQGRVRILMIYMPYDFQVYSPREEALAPSKKLGKFCQDSNIYFLDFTRVFKDQEKKYDIFLDDCHLSDKGHKIVAEYLKHFILRKNISKIANMGDLYGRE